MGVFKTILVPYDGSGPAKRAAAKAIELAKDQGAELYGVKVISFIGELIVPTDSVWAIVQKEVRAKAKGIIDEFVQMANEQGLNVQTTIRDGDITSEIVTYANEIGTDLIVMGFGGRGGRGKPGQHVVKVIREYPCPVMIVA